MSICWMRCKGRRDMWLEVSLCSMNCFLREKNEFSIWNKLFYEWGLKVSVLCRFHACFFKSEGIEACQRLANNWINRKGGVLLRNENIPRILRKCAFFSGVGGKDSNVSQWARGTIIAKKTFIEERLLIKDGWSLGIEFDIIFVRRSTYS